MTQPPGPGFQQQGPPPAQMGQPQNFGGHGQWAPAPGPVPPPKPSRPVWLYALVGALAVSLAALTILGVLRSNDAGPGTTPSPTPSPSSPATPTPSPSSSASPSATPSPTPTPTPTPEGPQPPFEVGAEVQLGRHTVPVPAGWQHTHEVIEAEQAERVQVFDPAVPGRRLLFTAHGTGAFADGAEGAAAVCNHHNERLVRDLSGERVYERPAHLVSANAAAEVARCGALGVASDAVEYDYAWAVLWEGAEGLVMLAQTDYALSQSGEVDETHAAFYTCHFAYWTGAALEGCEGPAAPSTIEPEEPQPHIQKPPFEVAQVLQLGQYTIPVPAGWNASAPYYEAETQTHFTELVKPGSPELKFDFVAHDPGPNSDQVKGLDSPGSAMCATYNKSLVKTLGGDVQEQGALPLTWGSGDTAEVIVCGALGEADDGVVYDYSWTVFWDMETPQGILMRQRSNWEMYQADQIDGTISDYYQCHLALEIGVGMGTC